MPIYEYVCDDGHLTERLQYDFKPAKATVCSCGKESYLQISLCTVKPDSHWNGTVLPNGKLVTNSKEYKDATENWETISDSSLASTKQRKLRRQKETEDKINKEVGKFVASELAGVSI